MTIDYDAPRVTATDSEDNSLKELAPQTRNMATTVLDFDEADPVESFELPGADLSDEELWVRVVPKRSDEFTCSSCFLVCHRSRAAKTANGPMICVDCV